MQDHKNLEIIVVDDGSTDHSASIVRSVSDSRIRIIELGDNRGISEALNIGISESKGDFIARMDGDDFSFPGRFSTQLKYFSQDSRLGVLGTQVLVNTTAGMQPKFPITAESFRAEYFFRNPLAHPTVMFRRDVVSMVPGPYDVSLRFAQDFSLWSKLLLKTDMYSTRETLLMLRTSAHLDTLKANLQQSAGRTERQRLSQMLGINPPPKFRNAGAVFVWTIRSQQILSKRRITSRKELWKAFSFELAQWFWRNLRARIFQGKLGHE
jgi:glycosyltransferase involved in cell wall biosynthesis